MKLGVSDSGLPFHAALPAAAHGGAGSQQQLRLSASAAVSLVGGHRIAALSMGLAAAARAGLTGTRITSTRSGAPRASPCISSSSSVGSSQTQKCRCTTSSGRAYGGSDGELENSSSPSAGSSNEGASCAASKRFSGGSGLRLSWRFGWRADGDVRPAASACAQPGRVRHALEALARGSAVPSARGSAICAPRGGRRWATADSSGHCVSGRCVGSALSAQPGSAAQAPLWLALGPCARPPPAQVAAKRGERPSKNLSAPS
ncbi:hypothetical protein T492DRAFT_1022061 [Pavlovales sp. CCMP2436]|nr:hypothetical protein T492DRAFT_1022061 [Pavlovales sp. CCMP2436]|mmetsp:Transcript_12876/g.32618  ORF Transcript_12876/g.32618 Transcript_12876/m.32618 type:complete len:260 (-) Transcript_12876:117-896(-)